MGSKLKNAFFTSNINNEQNIFSLIIQHKTSPMPACNLPNLYKLGKTGVFLFSFGTVNLNLY